MTEQKRELREEFSAGVVLFRQVGNQRRYLILHYPGGHFDFPKGHLEEGESEKQAALRELEEETGITDSLILENFVDEITYFFRRQSGLIKKKVTFFLARTEQSEVKISHEHQGYLWLDFERALDKITFENAKDILSKAEKFLQKHNI